jgi:hypothetical protein
MSSVVCTKTSNSSSRWRNSKPSLITQSVFAKAIAWWLVCILFLFLMHAVIESLRLRWSKPASKNQLHEFRHMPATKTTKTVKGQHGRLRQQPAPTKTKGRYLFIILYPHRGLRDGTNVPHLRPALSCSNAQEYLVVMSQMVDRIVKKWKNQCDKTATTTGIFKSTWAISRPIRFQPSRWIKI